MITGINRETGKPLDGWAHVVQSLQVIFSTRIGARIMRRLFGSAVPGLLGKNLEPSTLSAFYSAIIIAVELWEPRFSVRRITYPATQNSTANLAQGIFGFKLEGDYRPRALQGDFTVDQVKTAYF
ncbi:GPW/gp25 family protein [Methylovirgula sp. 4M-Z18]|uniref:GPW/gp25 family protein n=1 Tax=Methylovirgula sp. 4M-Z18 TaxID=2293567 RepID=UPI001FE23F75|nr:GPW/gp25 family protein [Methylovirgula sp. 4M-Z18]